MPNREIKALIKQKHQQLFDILMLQFRSGRWKKGEKLPSFRDLAQEYGVSINVVSKAIELLKEAGIVSVRVGDGVFSTAPSEMIKQEVRYSGNRIFGQYASAKPLRVLVEDTTTKQQIFWNSFFESTAAKFRDIDLEIVYGSGGTGEFDLAFGGINFLLRQGFSPEKILSVAEQEIFFPGLYDKILLTPENCRLGPHRNYFPYGFNSHCLVSPMPLPAALPDENVLDYIERLVKSDPGQKVGFGIVSGLELLSNSGIFFCDPETGEFQMPDHRQLHKVFDRIARLFQNGHLCWEHGEFRDQTKIANIAEMTTFLAHNQKGDFNIYPHPSGKEFSPIVNFAVISNKTLFPEVGFRILHCLLSAEIQIQAEHEHIFHAVRPCSPASLISKNKNRIPSVIRNAANAGLLHVLQYFATWELFHYITGKCDFNPRRLEAEIRWYITRAPLKKENKI